MFVLDRVHYKGKTYPVLSQAFGNPNAATGHLGDGAFANRVISAVPNKRIIIIQFMVGTGAGITNFGFRSGASDFKLSVYNNVKPVERPFTGVPWVIGNVNEEIYVICPSGALFAEFWGTLWWIESED